MNIKTKSAAGMSFGIVMTIFFLLQNFLIKPHQSTGQVMLSILSGIIAGTIGGFLFAWITGLFSKSKLVNNSMQINIGPGETIVFETPANHLKGLEGVGGKLYLTNKRLIFKSHKFNIQNHELSINLADIDNAERYNSMGIINNELAITTKNDTREKFVVDRGEEWLSFLTDKNSLQTA